MNGKLVIFSAPSGAGKSTIINKLLAKGLKFSFSISATSRAPRGTEKNGVEYWFLSKEQFQDKINNNEFVEYEEVYPGCFYGTLKSEINNKLLLGNNMLFDVDVKGGMNIKKYYADNALSIFILPPSVEVLKERLINRATDSAEMIEKRVAKAKWEMSFADNFDVQIINDDLEIAFEKVYSVINDFLKK